MKRVLIIDDDCLKEEESIREGFKGTDIDLFLCPTKDEAMKYIKSRGLFDCVVLDWYLDAEDSNLSQLILKELESEYFVPVLIYSAHAQNFRDTKNSGAITYPDNLIRVVNKGNFTEIKPIVSDWLNTNTTAKLSNIYLNKVYQNIHRTFWSLNEIPDGNIAAVYKNLISENNSIDWANDFIINLLLQNIIADKEFRKSISEMVNHLQGASPETTLGQKRKIVNKILYFHSTPEFLSNGDIIKVNMGNQSCYGFITTPDCDLYQLNTRYIEFIELVRFPTLPLGNSIKTISENKSTNHFYLPAIREAENLIDLVAIFKANHFLIAKDNRSDKYPGVVSRVKYLDTFVYNSADCSISYICSLVNPYKSELLSKKNSHDSRVGIPGVYEYLNDN